MSSSTISPYVPRGPVAAAIHQLRDVIIIATATVILATAWTNYNATRIVRKVNQLQIENNHLRQAASDNQKANDARALAGQQALSLLVQQVSQIHTLSPEQVQAVLGAVNAAIDTTTKALQKQGVPVTPIPKVTLPPAPAASPSSPVTPIPRAVASNALDWRVQIQCPGLCPHP